MPKKTVNQKIGSPFGKRREVKTEMPTQKPEPKPKAKEAKGKSLGAKINAWVAFHRSRKGR